MASYKRFEDVPVWRTAIELYLNLATVLKHEPRPPGFFRDQLGRAALSVSNNIAEGFERGTTNELLAFLYIARGSAGEVRSMLAVWDRLVEAGDLRSEISNLRSLAESCSRQIRAWAESLQESDIPGPRHLTSRSRAAYQRRQDAMDFERQLEAMTGRKLRPDRKS